MEKNLARTLCRLLSEASSIAGQVSRDALFYVLAAGLILPLPNTAMGDSTALVPVGAAQTQEPDRSPVQKVLNQISDLLAEVRKNPRAADVSDKLGKAYSLTSALEAHLQPNVERLYQAKKRAFETGREEDARYAADLEKETAPLKILKARQVEITKAMGAFGASFEGGIVVDPKLLVDKNNVAKVNVSMPPSDGKDGESPFKFKQAMGAWASKGYNGAMTFRNEYVVFSIAMGFISLAHMNWDPATNPNALEQWEKQTTDLVGVAGFGMFMLANHKVIHLLQAHRAKKSGLPMGPPTSLMTYVGMAAGSIASSMFHEMWTDKDIWQCVRPQYDSRAKAVEGSCERAFRTWVDGKKVMQYAPAIISMILSTYIAQAARGAIKKFGVIEAGKEATAKVVFRGARMLPMGSFARKGIAMAMNASIPGVFYKVGDMVIFLALDTYVTAEPTNQAWQEAKNNWFDIEAFSRDKLNLHSEFLWPKAGALQPIDNAFDVKATNLKDAHWYMIEFYKKMAETGWKRPAAPESCLPENIVALSKNGKPYEDGSWTSWLKRVWDFQTDNRVKSTAQLNCEVFAKPGELITRYGEKNTEWRTTLLGHFSAAQNNWLTMIGNFNQTYGASWNLAKYLANAKLRVSKGLEQKPDLSREALAKAISVPVKKDDEDPYQPEHTEMANSWYLDGTGMRLPTPEMVDYVVAGFACGPELQMEAGASQIGSTTFRAMDTLYTSFMHLVKSPSYMSTPYGSSLRFVPPKMTSKDREICRNIDQDVFKNMRYLMGDSFAASLIKRYLPEKQASNKTVVTTPFTGPFIDGAGKSYPTLAEYVYENLDTSLWESQGNYANVATFWTKYFEKPIAPVWKNYEIVYQEFLKSSYTPVLFNRDYRWGCNPAVTRTTTLNARTVKIVDPVAKGKADSDGFAVATLAGKGVESGKEFECAGDSAAYRVGEGVFLAIEIELRNYLRGLFSLHMSLVSKPEEKEAEKKQFMELANGMIDDIKAITPDEIQSKDFEQRLEQADEKAKALFAMLDARLKPATATEGAPAPATASNPEAAFRQEMLAKFKEQISKLLTEQKEHAGQYSRLNRADATAGAAKAVPDQNLNTLPSSNLFRRHGG